jgi:ketosteroid isomerase-like protein
MSTEQNKALAADLVNAISTGNTDVIRNLIDENCVWWVAGFPRNRPLTRDQMMRAARSIIDRVLPGGFNMKILNITAEDDRVAVEVEGHAYTVDKKLYNNFYHFLFVFRDGKVVRGMEYTNPQHAIEVLGDIVKGLGRREK